MSKVLLLNKDNVIIDIVDELKAVRKNTNNLVVLCLPSQAQGYIGSDGETIYPKSGSQFVPTYSDISGSVTVDEVADDVVPLQYRWDAETSAIVSNDNPYPEDNVTLTQSLAQTSANLEYVAMMADIEI